MNQIEDNGSSARLLSDFYKQNSNSKLDRLDTKHTWRKRATRVADGKLIRYKVQEKIHAIIRMDNVRDTRCTQFNAPSSKQVYSKSRRSCLKTTNARLKCAAAAARISFVCSARFRKGLQVARCNARDSAGFIPVCRSYSASFPRSRFQPAPFSRSRRFGNSGHYLSCERASARGCYFSGFQPRYFIYLD